MAGPGHSGPLPKDPREAAEIESEHLRVVDLWQKKKMTYREIAAETGYSVHQVGVIVRKARAIDISKPIEEHKLTQYHRYEVLWATIEEALYAGVIDKDCTAVAKLVLDGEAELWGLHASKKTEGRMETTGDVGVYPSDKAVARTQLLMRILPGTGIGDQPSRPVNYATPRAEIGPSRDRWQEAVDWPSRVSAQGCDND